MLLQVRCAQGGGALAPLTLLDQLNLTDLRVYLTLPYLTIPYLTVPTTLPYLTLPCLALHDLNLPEPDFTSHQPCLDLS